MARQKEKRTVAQSHEYSDPWYKRVWVVVSALGVVCFTLIVNAPVLLANLENLPADTTRVKNKFLSWYYDDAAWAGFWSSFPEGYVDVEDMELSKGDLKLEIDSVNGQISGIMVNKEICVAAPLSGYLLIEGKVSGDVAVIMAYDIVGGRRTNLIKAKLERQGIVMTVLPMEGNVDWIPEESRIGRHWNPDRIERDNFSDVCRAERDAVFKLLRKDYPDDGKKVRRPVSEY